MKSLQAAVYKPETKYEKIILNSKLKAKNYIKFTEEDEMEPLVSGFDRGLQNIHKIILSIDGKHFEISNL